jgi:hypothetical protein
MRGDHQLQNFCVSLTQQDNDESNIIFTLSRNLSVDPAQLLGLQQRTRMQPANETEKRALFFVISSWYDFGVELPQMSRLLVQIDRK